MFNLREYRKHPERLSDLLPWIGLIGEGIVLNKNGSFQTSLTYRGPDLDSATEEELIVSSAHLNNLLKRFGNGWSFFFEANRVPCPNYPQSEWQNPIPYLIDRSRRADFEGSTHFSTKYYFTFIYLPPSDSSRKFLGRFLSSSGSEVQAYDRHLEHFVKEIERATDLMQRTFPELALLNSDDTLTYLHKTISVKSHQIKTPEIPMYLDGILSDCPLTTGSEPRLSNHHIGVIGVLAFPTTSFPGLLDALNHLPFGYRWTTRFISIDRETARKELESYRRKWFAKREGAWAVIRKLMTNEEAPFIDSSALQKTEDANSALLDLDNDRVAFGYFTANIVILDTDQPSLNSKLRQIEQVVNGCGFVTKRETFNAVEAWLGTIPGNMRPNVRRPLLSTKNLSHLLPGASSVWAGQEQNLHFSGPALLVAETGGTTPFHFSNHIGDVGHTMIVGPTGAGKSTLLNLLAVQFLRYKDANVFIFDKGRSAETMTRSVGGEYFDIGVGGQLSFQPLRNIDNEEERSWAHEWLSLLVERENIPLTPQIKRSLWDALTGLASSPIEQRTLYSLTVLLQDNTLRSALFQFTDQGPHGEILDGTEDNFSGSFWQCFEMESLMETPTIVFPVLFYIFHRLEKLFKGSPTLLILDEAWLFLDNIQFHGKIREWLKTLRKKNVSVIFAAPNISDIDKSSLALTIKECCPTKIFLPNPAALQQDGAEAYERLGLNSRQREILAFATPKREYYYTSPLGNRLFNLNLDKLALAYCAGATKDRLALIKRISQETRSLFEFNYAFLCEEGLKAEAQDLLNLTKMEKAA